MTAEKVASRESYKLFAIFLRWINIQAQMCAQNIAENLVTQALVLHQHRVL